MTVRAALLALAACAGLTANTAQAACIDDTLAHAARLHEFEMMTMNASLRCSLQGIDWRSDYDAMVSAHQARFDGAAQALQRYFAGGAQVDAHHGGAWDRYATLIANRYGGGTTTPDACRAFAAVVVEVARASADDRTLGAVARAMVEHPLLERATCAQ
jgi:hypothetical protein